MGMKKSPAMPPPVDTSVTDRTAEKEAAVADEKAKMLAVKKKRSRRNYLDFRNGS